MKWKLVYTAALSLVIATNMLANDAQTLIKKVVEANGGVEALRALKDVSYEYTFRSKEKGIIDRSVERYIFDGEISYAQYTDRQYFVFADMKGIHTQFFDGSKTISKLNGEVLTEQQPAYVGHFFRKTNFYWFNMMFKLLDPGVNLKLLPNRQVNGQDYKIVEMTFGEKVGDTNDRYVLYVNPKTQRIDQFLFTVLGFGFKDPFLMKLQYEKIDDVYVSTYRKYAPADWDGNVIKEEWNEQISKNVRFNNGFTLQNIQDSFIEQSTSMVKKVDMPAKDAWRAISDWNNLNQLAPTVVDKIEVSGKGLNSNWTIYTKDGQRIEEKMTSFSDKKMSMTYKMTKTPMPLQDYVGSVKVRPIDRNNSEVIFVTHFKVEEENRTALLAAFSDFQETYLGNISKIN